VGARFWKTHMGFPPPPRKDEPKHILLYQQRAETTPTHGNKSVGIFLKP
jgi:hypothetical protein